MLITVQGFETVVYVGFGLLVAPLSAAIADVAIAVEAGHAWYALTALARPAS